MCPTGWFIPTAEGPGYLDGVMGSVHVTGELKVDGRYVPTAELAERKRREALDPRDWTG